jgi:hypothetical protein
MSKLPSAYVKPATDREYYRQRARLAREIREASTVKADPFSGIDYTDGDGSSSMPRPSTMLRADRGAA